MADDKQVDSSGPNPGDQAELGTPGTARMCAPCAPGTKVFSNEPCRNCGGTGVIVEGIGGA